MAERSGSGTLFFMIGTSVSPVKVFVPSDDGILSSFLS